MRSVTLTHAEHPADNITKGSAGSEVCICAMSECFRSLSNPHYRILNVVFSNKIVVPSKTAGMHFGETEIIVLCFVVFCVQVRDLIDVLIILCFIQFCTNLH